MLLYENIEEVSHKGYQSTYKKKKKTADTQEMIAKN